MMHISAVQSLHGLCRRLSFVVDFAHGMQRHKRRAKQTRRPGTLGGAGPSVDSDPEWQAVVDAASGDVYYWNTTTGATSWVWPPLEEHRGVNDQDDQACHSQLAKETAASDSDPNRAGGAEVDPAPEQVVAKEEGESAGQEHRPM